MKRKDELKIEVLSNIKDEIIDKQSAKRFALMNRKRKPKWMIPSSVAAVLLVAIMIPLFIVLFSKQVPIYEGMTVLSSYNPSAHAQSGGGTTLLSASGSGKTQIYFLKDDNGNHYGQNKKPVEDIVDDEFSSSLTIPEQQMYFAKPSQDIYIHIHISNPDSFEILSFTLNGKKYSSYMFEDGSDMENLILKVTVPAGAEGITEYTIDAIKYVDGTAIKDVRMEGDRTVKIGIYSAGKQPYAQIADEVIGINDVSFTVSLNDQLDLIEMSDGNVFAVICDNDSVIYKQELSLEGVNNIKVDSLTMDTTYRYAIIANYDSLDGTGFGSRILYEKEFTTKNIVAFKPASITQSSISFTLEWEDSFENKVLQSLTLYKGDEKIQELDVNATSISGLLSNNEYRLVATYVNKGQTEISDMTFTTQAKAEPTFTFNNMVSETHSIIGEYDTTNIDDTLLSYSVALYKRGELVAENTDKNIDFASLDYYTDYTVKIIYTFDVNDGKGVQEKSAEYVIKTLPYIDVTECKIANTSAVSEGDTIFMQVKLDNPLNMTVASVVVNGETYSVTGASTTNKIFVEIVYDGQFAGGDTYLKVDKVNAKIDTTELTVAPKTELSDNVFINGKLEVLKIEYVNESFEPIDWAFPSETVYVLITLDNPTGYTVDNLVQYGTRVWWEDQYSHDCDDPNVSSLTRLDDNRWYYAIGASEQGYWNDRSLTSLSYSNQYITKTITYSDMRCSFYRLISDEIHYISTPDDLKNMNGCCYYELTNDINLSDIEWLGNNFNGVFDGKGYSIKNMSFVGTIKNTDANFGLFSQGSGIVQNVNIKDATIIAEVSSDTETHYNANCGGIFGVASVAIINNCTVDNYSVLTVKNTSGEVSVGGLVGFLEGTTNIIINCINSGSISANSANAQTNNKAVAGGLVGKIGYRATFITNCTNNGNINATSTAWFAYAGGLVGEFSVGDPSILNFTNCANNGNVTAASINFNAYAGGLLGEFGSGSNMYISNCINVGSITVKSPDYLDNIGGGLVGDLYYGSASMINCINVGSLNGKFINGLAGYVNGTHLTIIDCYCLVNGSIDDIGIPGIQCSIDQLNSKEFYTKTLGWSADIWGFSELDFENGKYPKLK